MTQAQTVNILMICLPHSDQIRNLEFINDNGHVYFDWRGERFRIDGNLEVSSVEHGGEILSSSNISIILTALLRRTFAQLGQAK